MEGFDPHHPSSRSTPDSTDFEKVEREDVMEAAAAAAADSSTGEALRGGGDAPRIKLESPTNDSNSDEAASSSSGDPGSRDIFSFLDSLPSWALEVLYWHSPLKTGVIFFSCFSVLFLLSIYSAVAVFAYAALSILTVTFSFVVYRRCIAAIQKSPDVNPFQPYLDQDIVERINQDCQQCLEKAVMQAAAFISNVRHYFLIVDVFDSLKFSVFLWTLTYIGNWFNLLTLLLLSVISIFTLPKVYQVHHEQIDASIGMLTDRLLAQYPVIRGKVADVCAPVWTKIAAFIPAKAKSQ